MHDFRFYCPSVICLLSSSLAELAADIDFADGLYDATLEHFFPMIEFFSDFVSFFVLLANDRASIISESKLFLETVRMFNYQTTGVYTVNQLY